MVSHDTAAYSRSLPVGVHGPQKENCLIFNRLSHPSPTQTVPGASAGLQPSGDESDQLDQSAEITVIPEVRGRAAGHAEFTHPTQAPDKSVQEWQTFGLVRRSCRVHLFFF